MKNIILALIGLFIVFTVSFALLAGLLAVLFWCFGWVFSLRLVLGIWIIIAALIAFVNWIFFIGRKMADD